MRTRRGVSKFEMIDALFKTCAAGAQERGHGQAYDEISCGSACEPSKHKPSKLRHKDAGIEGLIPVDNMHMVIGVSAAVVNVDIVNEH